MESIDTLLVLAVTLFPLLLFFLYAVYRLVIEEPQNRLEFRIRALEELREADEKRIRTLEFLYRVHRNVEEAKAAFEEYVGGGKAAFEEYVGAREEVDDERNG